MTNCARRLSSVGTIVLLWLWTAGCATTAVGASGQSGEARMPLTLDALIAKAPALPTSTGWWFDGTSDFRSQHDGLGIALQYKSESAWITLYVFDLAQKDIAGAGADPRVGQATVMAVKEILTAYPDVNLGKPTAIQLCGGGWARVAMTLESDGKPLPSYLYVSTLPGYFIKVRATVLPGAGRDFQADIDRAVDVECGAILSTFGPRPTGTGPLL